MFNRLSFLQKYCLSVIPVKTGIQNALFFKNTGFPIKTSGTTNLDFRKSLRQDNGYVLITVLLMLLVLTVVGLAAIGTSTLENLLSGNIRLRESNLSQADGCVEISTAVIERTVRELDTQGFTAIVDAGLPTELSSTTFAPDNAAATPDVVCNVAPTAINVDIDKMYTHYISGTGIEFASGYEGLGKSGGSGFYSYYRINSTGTNVMNSTATVGTIYRYVPK